MVDGSASPPRNGEGDQPQAGGGAATGAEPGRFPSTTAFGGGPPPRSGEENRPPRVTATPAALALLAEIVADHGPVMFHQSGGCCDGSSPMCYPQGEFRTGAGDTLLGEVGGAPVWIGRAQGEAWAHTQLILDVVPGRGGMFSLDNGRERRFLTRGRVFDEDERAALTGEENT